MLELRLIRELPFSRAAISGDGAVIAGVDDDGRIVVTRGETRRMFDGPHGVLALSDDGSLLAGAEHADRALVLWDVATGKELGRATCVFDAPRIVHFAFHGDVLVCNNRHAWNVPSMTPAVASSAASAELFFQVARCTKRFVVGAPRFVDAMGYIVLWDEERDRAVKRFEVHRHYSYGRIAAVRDRFALIAGQEHSSETRIGVLDLVRGKVTTYDIQAVPALVDVSASSDGRLLIATNDASTSWLYEIDWKGEPEADALAVRYAGTPPIVEQLRSSVSGKPWGEPPPYLRALAWNHSELEIPLAQWCPAHIAKGMYRRAVSEPEHANDSRLWGLLARASLETGALDEAADAAAEGLGRNENDPELASIIEDARSGTIRIARPIQERGWEDETRWLFAGRTTENWLAGAQATSVFWNEVQKSDLQRIVLKVAKTTVTAFAACGERSAFGSSASVELWSHGSALTTYPMRDGVRSLAFRDERYLFVASPRGVHLLTLECLDAVHFLREHWQVDRENITALAAWGDGVLVLADGTLELRTETEVVPIANGITSIAASNELVVGGCDDGTLRRWDRTLEEKSRLAGHDGRVLAVATDRELVASIGIDGTVRWWRGDQPVGFAEHPDVRCVAIFQRSVVSAGRFIRMWPKQT